MIRKIPALLIGMIAFWACDVAEARQDWTCEWVQAGGWSKTDKGIAKRFARSAVNRCVKSRYKNLHYKISRSSLTYTCDRTYFRHSPDDPDYTCKTEVGPADTEHFCYAKVEVCWIKNSS